MDKTNSIFSEKEKKVRLIFAIRNHGRNWDRHVFIGCKKIGDLSILCAIGIHQSSLRLNYNHLTRLQYIAYLEDVVISMWNSNRNLIFVQDHNRFSQCGLVQTWRAAHPEITFFDWPRLMSDKYPLNNIWVNLKDTEDNITAIYRSWYDIKEDYDNFRHLFTMVKVGLKKVIWSCGSSIVDEESDESDIE